MNEILYINDIIIELPSNSISLTKQINDIGELEDRQSNYSNSIKIPPTPKNKRTFEMLGITGSTTRLPYSSLSIKYVVDGIELINNGKGIIKNTNEFYNLVIYDGNIDLLDLLDNEQLNDLDFSDYNHTLTVSNWIDSFTKTDGYIYGLGRFYEYASVSEFDLTLQNVSFYIHTLFEMIFEQKGYTITGDLLSDSGFLNSLISMDIGHSRIADSSASEKLNNSVSRSINESYPFPSFYTDVLQTYTSDSLGTHNIQLNGSLTHYYGDHVLQVIVDGVVRYSKFFETSSGTIDENFDVEFNVGSDVKIQVYSSTQSDGSSNVVRYNVNLTTVISYESRFIQINIQDLIGDTSQIDFVKDIMQRYGVMYKKVPNKNEFEFKKIGSIISDKTNYDDWSDKYSNFENESYSPNYAKRNYAKYQYDDSNNDFGDGYFTLNNSTLSDEKTLFTSIFKASDLDGDYNILNHWEAKTEDGVDVITPKTDGLRIFDKNIVNKTIYYKYGDDVVSVGKYTGDVALLDFESVNYQDSLDTYYSELSVLLDDYKVTTLSLNLNILDIYSLDFFKLKYFKQLGKFYYINKVSSFQKGKLTKVDLIEVPSSIVKNIEDVTIRIKLNGTSDLEANLTKSIVSTFYVDLVGSSEIEVFLSKPYLISYDDLDEDLQEDLDGKLDKEDAKLNINDETDTLQFTIDLLNEALQFEGVTFDAVNKRITIDNSGCEEDVITANYDCEYRMDGINDIDLGERIVNTNLGNRL